MWTELEKQNLDSSVLHRLVRCLHKLDTLAEIGLATDLVEGVYLSMAATPTLDIKVLPQLETHLRVYLSSDNTHCTLGNSLEKDGS